MKGRAREMAQRVKVFAPKTDNLNSMPGTHMVERANWIIEAVHML